MVVKRITGPIQMAPKMPMAVIMPTRRPVAREGPRMTMLAEILSANTVIRLIFLTQLYTLIWSRSIPRDQMVSREIHQLLEEVEVDQERTHTRDLTQEQRTSSRPLREKVDQLMFSAASRKFSILYSLNTSSKLKMVLWLRQTLTRQICTITQFSKILSSSQNSLLMGNWPSRTQLHHNKTTASILNMRIVEVMELMITITKETMGMNRKKVAREKVKPNIIMIKWNLNFQITIQADMKIAS
jgi:hypothetical protein